MTIDLQTMSLKELKELLNNVTKAIVSFEERKRREAIASLEAVARENGFSLSELVGGGFAPVKEKKQRTPAVAKYRNPDDKNDTWSGRGRQPRWFAAAIADGMTPEDMAV